MSLGIIKKIGPPLTIGCPCSVSYWLHGGDQFVYRLVWILLHAPLSTSFFYLCFLPRMLGWVGCRLHLLHFSRWRLPLRWKSLRISALAVAALLEASACFSTAFASRLRFELFCAVIPYKYRCSCASAAHCVRFRFSSSFFSSSAASLFGPHPEPSRGELVRAPVASGDTALTYEAAQMWRGCAVCDVWELEVPLWQELF